MNDEANWTVRNLLEMLERVIGEDIVIRTELEPGLRVLLTSGYADQKSQWPIIHERGYPFLQKPHALADLLAALRDVLGAPAAGLRPLEAAPET
jgi:DNA-binding NtrC family response regulator